MTKVVIATIKSWNIKNVKKLEIPGCEIILIDKKEDLIYERIKAVNPRYVFFIHWSWYIPKEIFESFECIVFHPARLPYGRGGSPIQNLIIRGFKDTAISAVRVCEELDAGDLYPISQELSLEGTAEEILMRMSNAVCFHMIPWIIANEPPAKKQEGDAVVFSRRMSADSELNFNEKTEKIYDMIRMLDGEGYPSAFIKIGNYRIEFSRASLKEEGIKADVIIREEGKNE